MKKRLLCISLTAMICTINFASANGNNWQQQPPQQGTGYNWQQQPLQQGTGYNWQQQPLQQGTGYNWQQQSPQQGTGYNWQQQPLRQGNGYNGGYQQQQTVHSSTYPQQNYSYQGTGNLPQAQQPYRQVTYSSQPQTTSSSPWGQSSSGSGNRSNTQPPAPVTPKPEDKKIGESWNDSSIERLSQSCKTLTTECGEAKKQVEELEARLEKERTQFKKELGEKDEQMKKERTGFEGDLKKKDAQIEELKIALAKKEEELSAVNNTSDKYLKDNEKLRAQLEAAEKNLEVFKLKQAGLWEEGYPYPDKGMKFDHPRNTGEGRQKRGDYLMRALREEFIDPLRRHGRPRTIEHIAYIANEYCDLFGLDVSRYPQIMDLLSRVSRHSTPPQQGSRSSTTQQESRNSANSNADEELESEHSSSWADEKTESEHSSSWADEKTESASISGSSGSTREIMQSDGIDMQELCKLLSSIGIDDQLFMRNDRWHVIMLLIKVLFKGLTFEQYTIGKKFGGHFVYGRDPDGKIPEAEDYEMANVKFAFTDNVQAQRNEHEVVTAITVAGFSQNGGANRKLVRSPGNTATIELNELCCLYSSEVEKAVTHLLLNCL